jgi:hypothetical protein
MKRLCAEWQLELLTGLLTDASPGRVAEALEAIHQLPDGWMYRREAWRDTIKALKVAAASDGVRSPRRRSGTRMFLLVLRGLVACDGRLTATRVPRYITQVMN